MTEFCASVEPPMNEHRKKRINQEAISYSKDSTKAVRPPPKVIEFVEPGKQRREKIFSMVKKKNIKAKGNQSNTPDSNEPDFKCIAREVKEFGITGLSFKERKRYQQQKAQALGGRAPKGLKVPYPMLMDRIKRRKEKEKEKLEKERAMGNFKKNKSNKQRPTPTRTSMGRWVDNSSRGLSASVGKYRAGVQLLSKADILKIRTAKR